LPLRFCLLAEGAPLVLVLRFQGRSCFGLGRPLLIDARAASTSSLRARLSLSSSGALQRRLERCAAAAVRYELQTCRIGNLASSTATGAANLLACGIPSVLQPLARFPRGASAGQHERRTSRSCHPRHRCDVVSAGHRRRTRRARAVACFILLRLDRPRSQG